VAVGFDAVGPSSSGGSSTSATTVTWAHTITGSSTVLIAGCALDAGSDAGFSMTATYNSVAMTALGSAVHSGGITAGFLQVWGNIAAAGAAHNVVVTAAGGTPAGLSGGSLSFTGAGQTIGAAFGTPATANTPAPTTTPSAALAANTSGNIIAGFCCSGSGFTSATAPSTSRFIGGSGFTGAAGQSAGATSPSTGSSVTMAWLTGSDDFAEILVEILAAASGIPTGLASGTGAALNPAIVTSTVTVGPRYAGTGTDLGGVYGSWGTPQLASGGP
jgi:hypothetical protein